MNDITKKAPAGISSVLAANQYRDSNISESQSLEIPSRLQGKDHGLQ